MKLFWVLMCAFTFSVSANTFAQQERVSLDLKDVAIRTLFDEIQRQTSLYFVFNTELTDRLGQLSVNVKDETVENVLKKVLENTGLTYKFRGDLIVIQRDEVMKDEKKGKRITGVVIDGSTKGVLPGVTVKLCSETTVVLGTATDERGRFELMLPVMKGTLEFSFVGFESLKVNFTEKTDSLKIMLNEKLNELEDVVVTGYQQIDRRHTTSSVTSVKMKDIKVPGVTNLVQMLEGKIPDMVLMSNSGEINATPRLRIRGTSTIIGNREPLWVVDGIIVNDPVNLSPDVLNDPDYVNRIGNAISGLNPQDIERLDVLKDAAATALYGTRAANGVIVITTKKGRVGKPIVSYSAQATFRRRPRYTDKRIDLMNSQERVDFSQHLVDMHYEYPSNMPLVGYEYAVQQLYDREITPDEFQAEVAKLQTMNTDWFDVLCDDSFSHDHNVSVSGGSEKIRYYVSLGCTDEDDVNKATNRRYTATAKMNMTLSPKVQLSFNLNGYLNDKKYAQDDLNPIDYAYNTSRAIPAYNPDGSYAFYKKEVYSTVFMNYSFLNELANSYKKQSTTGTTMTANLRYTPLEWLSLDGILSTSVSNADIEGYWGEKTFYVTEKRESEYGEPVPLDSEFPFGGELSRQMAKNRSYTARLQANVNKYFGESGIHYLNVAVGGEINSNRYEEYSRTDRGYYRDRGKNFVTDVPDTYAAYVRWMVNNTPTIMDNRTNLLAAYATVSYSYGDYFTLNANMRYDGSNKFGSRSNEKLLPIWSVSSLANLKEISGLKADWVDNFSLKVSYGEQGNMLDGQYPELVLKKGAMNAYYGETQSVAHRFANPDLKWEKTRTVNFGLESSFLKGRLMVGMEYYCKKTVDAFMNKTISDVNGFTSYEVNSGIMENKGYNVNLTTTPVKLTNFYWTLSGSLSKIVNEMKVAPGKSTYDLSEFMSGNAVVKGQPIGTFWSYRFLGLSPLDGGPLFDDAEELQGELAMMSKYDVYTRLLEPSGQRSPDITGSLNNTFTYKSWRLNIGMTYSLGAKTRLFRVFKDFYEGYSSEMNINREILKAWKKPGDELETNIPAVMGTASDGYWYHHYHWTSWYSGPRLAPNSWEMYDYSNVRVVSADYLKIQSVSLTYELPKHLLEAWGVQRLAVSIGGTNLYTFCNKRLKGQTPTQGGFTEIQLSDTPTYTLGLTLDF